MSKCRKSHCFCHFCVLDANFPAVGGSLGRPSPLGRCGVTKPGCSSAGYIGRAALHRKALFNRRYTGPASYDRLGNSLFPTQSAPTFFFTSVIVSNCWDRGKTVGSAGPYFFFFSQKKSADLGRRSLPHRARGQKVAVAGPRRKSPNHQNTICTHRHL